MSFLSNKIQKFHLAAWKNQIQPAMDSLNFMMEDWINVQKNPNSPNQLAKFKESQKTARESVAKIARYTPGKVGEDNYFKNWVEPLAMNQSAMLHSFEPLFVRGSIPFIVYRKMIQEDYKPNTQDPQSDPAVRYRSPISRDDSASHKIKIVKQIIIN